MEQSNKKLMWYNVTLMAFTVVWSFGNVVNNFAAQGLQVITSWIFIMFLYFLPYCLMVGELGSVFSESEGGVSSWVKNTSTAKLAYLAAWTYWVVHVPYIASKPQSATISLSWVLTAGSDAVDKFSTLELQIFYMLIFGLFVFLATKGITSIRRLSSIAGTAMFTMGILYIILALSALVFNDGISFATQNLTDVSTWVPTMNLQYLTTLSLLVFAVGGIEKISPYVKDTKDAPRAFPKAMIVAAVMIIFSAILGSIAMGSMFDAANRPDDLFMNGAYYSFQILGDWYGVGNLFVRIYALSNLVAQLSVLLISIDAPLKILLMDTESNFIPSKLKEKNKNGAPVYGYAMLSVLVISLLFLPILNGAEGSSVIFEWLLKLNSVVMPLRYLWVFVAYILLKKNYKSNVKPAYQFVKNRKLGIAIASWCFIYTAIACIGGIYSDNLSLLLVNLITPFVLIGLGFILPAIAKRTN